MYDIIEFAVIGLLVLTGLFMFLFPEKSTKKELRDNYEAVNKMKSSGLFIAIFGAVAFVIKITMF